MLFARRAESFSIRKLLWKVAGEVGSIADRGCDDLAGRQAGAAVYGDHAQLVLAVSEHHGLKTVTRFDHQRHLFEQGGVGLIEPQREGLSLGHHHELGEVQRIGAFTQHLALRALLAALLEKAARILKVVGAVEVRRQRLVGAEGAAVTRKDIADAALGNGHQRLDMKPVLEGEEQVHAAAQNVGLVPRFTFERDQCYAVADGAIRAPQLFDDGDAIVADVPEHPRCLQNEGCQDEQKQRGPRLRCTPKRRHERPRPTPGWRNMVSLETA